MPLPPYPRITCLLQDVTALAFHKGNSCLCSVCIAFCCCFLSALYWASYRMNELWTLSPKAYLQLLHVQCVYHFCCCVFALSVLGELQDKRMNDCFCPSVFSENFAMPLGWTQLWMTLEMCTAYHIASRPRHSGGETTYQHGYNICSWQSHQLCTFEWLMCDDQKWLLSFSEAKRMLVPS